ncbi:MAG: hypothetical protein FWD23_00360, partial [Oscillospiraceae bacterium]|nr:hypothetical protein [Oscillospiraceae bacterium]
RMNAHIAKREGETGRQNPMITNAAKWNGFGRPFASSDDAYNSMHIGDVGRAQRLQALAKEKREKSE